MTHSGMVRRRKHEHESSLSEHPLLFTQIKLNGDTERFKHIGTAAFAGDGPVAVLGHGHTGGGAQERAGGGGEVAVDEIIQLQMANRILDVNPPETIVLLTGDGSGYADDKGFIKQLERAHKHGWNIEVVSWDLGCNRYLKKFAQGHGVYHALEPAYNDVTFINNKRWAN